MIDFLFRSDYEMKIDYIFNLLVGNTVLIIIIIEFQLIFLSSVEFIEISYTSILWLLVNSMNYKE